MTHVSRVAPLRREAGEAVARVELEDRGRLVTAHGEGCPGPSMFAVETPSSRRGVGGTPSGVTRTDRRDRLLAACLSALAGYVDALGFLALGGFFVSFMSGNSTRIGVGLAQGSRAAAEATALVGAFVLGVIAGALVGRGARRQRAAALLLVAGLLAVAAALGALGLSRPAALAMALAMGAENTVFQREGEVSIGVTYMTGTLVKLGQRLAAALTGGDRTAWVPYLLLWGGLVSGAAAGALAHRHLGLGGLWGAAGAAVLLAAAVRAEPSGGADSDG